jgi:cystathionine beta-synthase
MTTLDLPAMTAERQMRRHACKNILQTIGHTPVVQLNRVLAGICAATVLAKVEFFNPGGSVKDRIALSIIEDAEQRGVLRPGGTIVEAIAGAGLRWLPL